MITKEYFEKLHANKLEKLEEIYKFLDAFDQSKWNKEDMKHQNRSIISNEIETVIVS
jgi:hypothetical protein